MASVDPIEIDGQEVVIDSPDTARLALVKLGEMRKAQEDADADLAGTIRRVLEQANGMVSKTEAATLLHMHRTTLYRVYGDD